MKRKMNLEHVMSKRDARWETRKFPKRDTKPRKAKEIELCRVIPIRLAQMPNIYDWLESQRKTRLSIRINMELNMGYKSLSEFMHVTFDPTFYENRDCLEAKSVL